MKGSKGLYTFTVGDFENTDCLHVSLGSEEAYIPMRDIYDAAETHKHYEQVKNQLNIQPEECMEKSESKLEQQLRKFSVLAKDVRYLLVRIEQGNLASSAEMLEVQEEVHDMQRILADCDAYVAMNIAKLVVQRMMDGLASQLRRQAGIRSE